MNEPLASVVAMTMTSTTKPETATDGGPNPDYRPAADLAYQLDNIGYHPDFTKEQLQFAIDNGLVIVYGASDDLMEFDGAIREELSAWEGTVALVDAHGVITEDRSEPAGPHQSIYAFWCSDEADADGFTWSYKTDIPHSTFRMMDGEEKYCRGIVFALADVK